MENEITEMFYNAGWSLTGVTKVSAGVIENEYTKNCESVVVRMVISKYQEMRAEQFEGVADYS